MKHVYDNYPAEKLPKDLRNGLKRGERVRVIVEAMEQRGRSHAASENGGKRHLRAFWGAGRGLYNGSDDAVASIRALRNEWE